MNDWQKRMISASERPLGSKSAPPCFVLALFVGLFVFVGRLVCFGF